MAGLDAAFSVFVSVGLMILFAALQKTQFLDVVKNFVVDKMANAKRPEATVEDVDFKSVTNEFLEILVKVSVSNPYVVPLPICEISYSLKSDGREIASGKIEAGSLKANDKTLVEVPVKVACSIFSSLAGHNDYQLDLGLVIDLPVIGNFTIPLSHKLGSDYSDAISLARQIISNRANLKS